MAAALSVEAALQRKRVWWVAPIYSIASIGWREVRALAKQIPGVTVNESEKRITFPGDGWIQIKSADNPDSLRGEGLDFVVLDECAWIQPEAWTEALRPALADRKGRALFISTPKGRNLFWQLYQQGQDPANAEWASWSQPTSANPFIDAGEIDAMRRGLPEMKFRQECLAEFLEDGAGVFRRVIDAVVAVPQDAALPGHQYVIGCDWGKSDDFTVLTVLDETTSDVVCIERFNQIDYTVQRGRLLAMAERFLPTQIIAERNSIGEPVIEQLQRDGLPITPFTTTNASKTQAIDALALAFERGDIRIPNDAALLAELQAFEMERLPSGLLRYSAPSNMHDDCVMSLAFAWSASHSFGDWSGALAFIREENARAEVAA